MLAFAVAVGTGLGAPLAVVQVLVVNLVTDGLPAVALAQDPADPSTMRSPARHSAQLFGWRLWSVMISVAVVAAAVYLPATHEALSTVSLSRLAALVAVALSLLPFALVEGAEAARRPSRPAPCRVVRREDFRQRERSGVLARGPQG